MKIQETVKAKTRQSDSKKISLENTSELKAWWLQASSEETKRILRQA